MPPKTITRDKFIPLFSVIHYNPDGTVHDIQTQYVLGASADPDENKIKLVQAADNRLPMASGLTNALLADLRAAEGL